MQTRLNPIRNQFIKPGYSSTPANRHFHLKTSVNGSLDKCYSKNIRDFLVEIGRYAVGSLLRPLLRKFINHTNKLHARDFKTNSRQFCWKRNFWAWIKLFVELSLKAFHWNHQNRFVRQFFIRLASQRVINHKSYIQITCYTTMIMINVLNKCNRRTYRILCCSEEIFRHWHKKASAMEVEWELQWWALLPTRNQRNDGRRNDYTACLMAHSCTS